MKKPRLTLALTTVLLLQTSCGGPSIRVSPPAVVCSVPSWPDNPQLEFSEDCPDSSVCLTPESAARLYLWIREVMRIKEAIAGCPPANGV